MKAWERQKELQKRYVQVPNIAELDIIIGRIKVGKINIDQQTKRARALFALYYLTACRASEILKTTRLKKQRMKKDIIFEEDGTKKVVCAVDKNKEPVIERWFEEHSFLGTRSCDLRMIEHTNHNFLEIRTENRKNKNKKTKLLPIPIDKEIEILKYLNDYLASLQPEELLFKFTPIRARQIINKSTGMNIHFIRHIRATHLITLYSFNEQMLIKFMGWSDSRPAKSYMQLSSEDLAREFYKNG